MFIIKTKEYTVPQREGKDPDIKVTAKTIIPVRDPSVVVMDEAKGRRSKKRSARQGVSRGQFHSIFDKAPRPIKSPKSDSEQS